MATFTKREILNLILKNEEIDSAFKYVLQKLNFEISDIKQESLTKLKNAISCLYSRYKAKFKAVHGIKDRFELKNADWLNSDFQIPDLNVITNETQMNSHPNFGRPALDFECKSVRSKRREVAKISNEHNNDVQKLMMASSYAANKSKPKDLKRVLDELIIDSESPAKILKLESAAKESSVLKKKTPLESLSFCLDHSISKSTYTDLRLQSKESGANIWPSYNQIREEKSKLRPPKEFIQVNDTTAEVSLQALLNHTAERIVEMQKEVLLHVVDKNQCTKLKLNLICSWGFDGSSGHSAYKQQYDQNEDQNKSSDENLFATTLIPLRLNSEHGDVLWNNRNCQSPRFCRPIQLRYVKESLDIILHQKQVVEDQIDKLEPFEIIAESCQVSISYSMHLTLIDGKVLSAITNTRSMQSCPICHSKPSSFNDLSNRGSKIFTPILKTLSYGISSLHAWIRFLECCLHISYRLLIKVWKVSGAENKEKVAERKRTIQEAMWQKFGLRIDKPKAGGCGNTNDGNTARRAFSNPKLFAETLGLNEQLIQNFQTILIALSCQLSINETEFEKLCSSTAEIYVSHYNWYPMPSSVHRILIHGGEIIKQSVLPVGMLGEEASESRNKDYRMYKRFHCRKNSRKNNLEDLFNRTMDTSDPMVSTLSLKSRLNNNKKLTLPKAVQELLSEPQIVHNNSLDSEYESDTEDESYDENIDIGLSAADNYLDSIELSGEESSEES